MNVALRPEHLNILSICTGGGGLDLGVELAIQGARTVCMVEREAFAVATLASAMEAGLMAQAPIWSDARTFDGRPWRGAVDGLIGGIPCQPHSLAGRKLGSYDERDLWSDARRIITQSRAWFVLIENVAGMLAAGDDEIAGAERVHRDLCKLGFEVEGGLFTAKEVRAPHERERVFILGVADPRRGSIERWRAADDLSRSAAKAEGQGYQRQRHGHAVGDGREDLADAARGGRGREGHVGQPSVLADEAILNLVNAESNGRRKGRTEPEFSKRVGSASTLSSSSVGDTDQCASQVGESDASVFRRRFVQSARDRAASGDPGLFPPGPDEIEAWDRILGRSPELEPAFRRVADGVASKVDLAQQWARVDRLRQLGNGVVCLEAAYALRTLVTRLAARGSTGATRLVRMMEAA